MFKLRSKVMPKGQFAACWAFSLFYHQMIALFHKTMNLWGWFADALPFSTDDSKCLVEKQNVV
jgi:hypothetical protein